MAILQVELVQDLPEGWVPLEVISVVKCLDEKGDPGIAVRQSGNITAWEAVGMMTAAMDIARDALKSDFTPGTG